jgi:hypothetical protein
MQQEVIWRWGQHKIATEELEKEEGLKVSRNMACEELRRVREARYE